MTNLPLPSEARVAEAADAVLELFQGQMLSKENVIQVARLVLSLAWCQPHVTNRTRCDPYARWCPSCGAIVRADYKAHPTQRGVRAMLCPTCQSVTRPIVSNGRPAAVAWRQEARSQNWSQPIY